MARKGLSPQIKDPNKLCLCVRRRYLDYIEGCKAEGISLVLIETLRALDRQKHYKRIGVSWTLDSKHLPQPPHDLALAFDVVPKDYIREPEWRPTGVLWTTMRHVARRLGLIVGAPWPRDKGHNYLRKCLCAEDAQEPAA